MKYTGIINRDISAMVARTLSPEQVARIFPKSLPILGLITPSSKSLFQTVHSRGKRSMVNVNSSGSKSTKPGTLSGVIE